MFARTCALVVAAASLTLAAHGAAIQAPVAPVVHFHAPVALNPHLHGFATVSPRTVPKAHVALKTVVLSTPHIRARHPWENGWNVAAWQASHLNYGEVSGTVVDSQGHPLRNLLVWLRYASGHPVHHPWEAHSTRTDAGGHFIMKHVISKDYRLCVKENKVMEHVQFTVNRGHELRAFYLSLTR